MSFLCHFIIFLWNLSEFKFKCAWRTCVLYLLFNFMSLLLKRNMKSTVQVSFLCHFITLMWNLSEFELKCAWRLCLLYLLLNFMSLPLKRNIRSSKTSLFIPDSLPLPSFHSSSPPHSLTWFYMINSCEVCLDSCSL